MYRFKFFDSCLLHYYTHQMFLSNLKSEELEHLSLWFKNQFSVAHLFMMRSSFCPRSLLMNHEWLYALNESFSSHWWKLEVIVICWWHSPLQPSIVRLLWLHPSTLTAPGGYNPIHILSAFPLIFRWILTSVWNLEIRNTRVCLQVMANFCQLFDFHSASNYLHSE